MIIDYEMKRSNLAELLNVTTTVIIIASVTMMYDIWLYQSGLYYCDYYDLEYNDNPYENRFYDTMEKASNDTVRLSTDNAEIKR